MLKKLSEILGWPVEKQIVFEEAVKQMDLRDGIIKNLSIHITYDKEAIGFNTALTSCDREIDREALDSALSQAKNVEDFISTMPTWLKPTERK